MLYQLTYLDLLEEALWGYTWTANYTIAALMRPAIYFDLLREAVGGYPWTAALKAAVSVRPVFYLVIQESCSNKAHCLLRPPEGSPWRAALKVALSVRLAFYLDYLPKVLTCNSLAYSMSV